MDRLEQDFDETDYIELDDVLDTSFFAEDELADLEEDESYFEES